MYVKRLLGFHQQITLRFHGSWRVAAPGFEDGACNPRVSSVKVASDGVVRILFPVVDERHLGGYPSNSGSFSENHFDF